MCIDREEEPSNESAQLRLLTTEVYGYGIHLGRVL